MKYYIVNEADRVLDYRGFFRLKDGNVDIQYFETEDEAWDYIYEHFDERFFDKFTVESTEEELYETSYITI